MLNSLFLRGFGTGLATAIHLALLACSLLLLCSIDVRTFRSRQPTLTQLAALAGNT